MCSPREYPSSQLFLRQRFLIIRNHSHLASVRCSWGGSQLYSDLPIANPRNRERLHSETRIRCVPNSALCCPFHLLRPSSRPQGLAEHTRKSSTLSNFSEAPILRTSVKTAGQRNRSIYTDLCPFISATSVIPPTLKRKYSLFKALAMERAMLVLPTPGGP